MKNWRIIILNRRTIFPHKARNIRCIFSTKTHPNRIQNEKAHIEPRTPIMKLFANSTKHPTLFSFVGRFNLNLFLTAQYWSSKSAYLAPRIPNRALPHKAHLSLLREKTRPEFDSRTSRWKIPPELMSPLLKTPYLRFRTLSLFVPFFSRSPFGRVSFLFWDFFRLRSGVLRTTWFRVRFEKL